MELMNILYITKLKNTMANGVTIAVTQLLNSICNYADIGWLDVGNVEIDLDQKIKRIQLCDLQLFNADIAVFEDPFNTLEFCKIAKELKKSNIPYVIVPHGCFTRNALRKKALKKYIAIGTLFHDFLYGCSATQFLCVNEREHSLCFNDSLIIPNGIYDSKCYRVRNQIKRIVFLSRKDIQHKGIDYLLEGIKKEISLLRAQEVKIDLYGPEVSNIDENYISNFISSNHLEDILTNNGPVFGEEKDKVFNSSDAFILTSRYEGFPMAILEALSFGLPVLITDGTNLNEIIEEGQAGWTCHSSIDDVARMIRSAVECDDCSEISKNARNLSLKYTWNEVSKMTISEYSKLLTKGHQDYE